MRIYLVIIAVLGVMLCVAVVLRHLQPCSAFTPRRHSMLRRWWILLALASSSASVAEMPAGERSQL